MSYRSVIIGIVLSLIAVWWMHQASLVQAPGLLYAPVYLLSVPPVPAVFCLILLVALVPLTTRLFRGALGKKEMIFIYMVLVIAIPPVTFGVTESMLPAPTAATYFAAPDNHFAAFAEAMPQWFYPHDDEVIRAMYEGSDDGSVPWGPWAYPLTMWILFIGLLFFTGTCLLTLFRKQWVENERLRFPLLFIPMSIVEKEAPGSHVPFFRHPLVWIGVIIVVIHHALNIAPAYNPAVMALQDRFYLGRQIFTEYPWTVYRGVPFFHRPQVIGLAYFVPLDILFSGWFFFLLQPTLRLFSELFGISATPGFPHTLAQSAGGLPGDDIRVVLGRPARTRRNLPQGVHGGSEHRRLPRAVVAPRRSPRGSGRLHRHRRMGDFDGCLLHLCCGLLLHVHRLRACVFASAR